MSSAVLQVIADSRKYQAELAKLPGYTEKSAAKAGLKLAQEHEKAQAKAAAAAVAAAKRAGDAWDVAIKVKIVDSLINAGILVAQTFAQWAVDGIKAADSMGDLSEESGVAVETLLAIREAAMRAGEEFEPLQQSFAGMAKKIYDFAATGGGKAADVFRDLGVEVHNADGTLRSVNAISVETISRLQGLTDETQKAALATKLLGDSGQEMLRVLGDTAIDEWAASMSGAAEDVAATNEGLDAMNLALADMQSAAGDTGSALLAAFGQDLAKAIGYASGMASILASDVQLVYDFFAAGADTSKASAAFDDWEQRTKDIQARYERLKATIDSIGMVPNSPMMPGAADPFAKGPMANAFGPPTTNAASNRPADDARRAAEVVRSVEDEAAAAEAERQAASLEGWRVNTDAKIAEAERFRVQEEADHQDALRRIEEQKAAAADAAAVRAQTNQQIMSGAANVASSLFSLYDSTLQAQVDATESGTDAHRAALRKQWEAQHAAASAAALVNIAMAVSESLASAPYPANLVLAGLAAVSAGAAFAKVASAKPPSFHVGNAGRGGMVTDEYQATLKRREVVVDAPTVAANGGPNGVRQALGGGGQAVYVSIALDGKELDAVVDRRLAARGIPPRGHKFRQVA